MISHAAEFAALLAVFLILVTFVGYPLFTLLAFAVLPEWKRDASDKLPLTCTIIVAAYNEETVIGKKLESLIPALADGRCDLIVVDDGSNDRTPTLVEAFREDHREFRIENIIRPRSGKSAALNHAASIAMGQILIFTDADTIWTPCTLPELLAPFARPDIGAVAGNVLTAKKGRKFEFVQTLFRRYESTIRGGENKLFGCVSSDGGLHAVRREHFEKVPPGVTDDFFISTGARVNGRKIWFADKAIVFEDSIERGDRHFSRRVRITIRGLQSLTARATLLNPARYGLYSIGLFFHKVMRRLAPVFAIMLLPLIVVLALNDAFFGFVSLAVAILCLVSVAFVRHPRAVPKPFHPVALILSQIGAVAFGVLAFILGRRIDRWAPQKAEG